MSARAFLTALHGMLLERNGHEAVEELLTVPDERGERELAVVLLGGEIV